jgi:DNA-binding NarL/FixJ family response regulator
VPLVIFPLVTTSAPSVTRAATASPSGDIMIPLEPRSGPTVLILKADQLYAEALRAYALRAFPDAVTIVASSCEFAARVLATQWIDIFITGIDPTLEGDVLDLLDRSAPGTNLPRRSLAIVGRYDLRTLGVLRTLEIAGIFDAVKEAPARIIAALGAIVEGRRYCSPSILEQTRPGGSVSVLLHMLTTFEQLVFSVIGDGCDDGVAACELAVSPSTVSTVRRDLHRKLNVQHRGELVRAAAQHGFVHFTPTGVVRPGFATLAEAFHARRSRSHERSSARDKGVVGSNEVPPAPIWPGPRPDRRQPLKDRVVISA